MFSTPVRSREGVYLGRLYVLRDVTREREVDRMKTEFVSMVSHELRTPLTSIKGYIDLVLEGEAGEVSGEQGEFLRIVKNNADRLVALVNDLLDVSRIEAGKIQLNRQPLDLISLIRNVSTSLRPALDGKVQHLALDLPPALPSTLGDPDRVTQILTNLLSNAHKYTPQGGRIRIAVRPEPGQLRVDVEDTGVGLSPEEQQQVFTRFFRARNRATQQVGGTGLGLAITRSLVEMHGGEITLSSAPGNGSTFSFTLPTTEQAIEPAGPTPAPPRGGRILVVDDEPDIAQLIRRYLERAGYEVLVAHGGADALDVAQVERPDLITLDIVLPDMDGFTVLERLGSQPDTASIPVVLLSMLGDSGRGKLLGAIDYLTKPVRDSVLLHRVAAILSASRSRLVLVADDEAEVRVIIARHLRQAGYEVVEAADGAEAIEMAKRHLPGLALIDVKMPRMDGVAALRALRADEATRDIAVIVMTASAGVSGESQRAVEGLGGLFVQGKPLTPEELAASIAHCLRDEASPPSHADG